MARKKSTGGYTVPKGSAAEEELRRLTQLANRRISSAFKAYEKEGKTVVPREVVGDIQTREEWFSSKYALSRSKNFASEKEFKKHMHWLRQFEHMRPGITEYTQIQREKTLISLTTALGHVPPALAEMVNKMSAPQLSEFWDKFSKASSRMGMKYSSGDAAQTATQEFFSEDKQGLAMAGLGADIKTRELTKGKAIKTKKKRKKGA